MAEFKKIPVIVVAGPTASGKTGLAVELCKALGGEVVSADSMQIYKGMFIATAKPTAEEMQGISHYMMDFLEPSEPFSVAQYCKQARVCIEDIALRGKLPVIAGGTGLYISSLIDNVEFSQTQSDYELREKLRKKAEAQGAEALLSELREIDPETADTLHPNNLGRIIRALEVYYTSGITLSKQKELSRLKPSPYNSCMLLLTVRERKTLYDRIDSRVDIMLEKGLLNEAEAFLQAQSDIKTAGQAIGYKELEPYFKGNASLEECIENLKRETRRYAKRQLTWFNKDERMKKIYIDDYDGLSGVLRVALKIINKTLGL
ncbi:MAG: tRNA (adenosine(37)-N6)-dimethylallyltransferase MiaA [Clostridiales bacterium]|nr:tRNA (adenosine(37)-N6)-dimethylallyltransferase MiaA [Clostridiales bacterium]